MGSRFRSRTGGYCMVFVLCAVPVAGDPIRLFRLLFSFLANQDTLLDNIFYELVEKIPEILAVFHLFFVKFETISRFFRKKPLFPVWSPYLQTLS